MTTGPPAFDRTISATSCRAFCAVARISALSKSNRMSAGSVTSMVVAVSVWIGALAKTSVDASNVSASAPNTSALLDWQNAVTGVSSRVPVVSAPARMCFPALTLLLADRNAGDHVELFVELNAHLLRSGRRRAEHGVARQV